MNAKAVVIGGLSLFLGAAMVPSGVAEACSRILSNTSKLGVFTSRTMDWPESTEPKLMVFPRGIARNGGLLADQVVVRDNPARWTSRYGSMITSVYGIGAVDGFNERGLAGHLLYLNATDFGPRDPAKPAVHVGLQLQYVLDNAATVAEALALLDKVSLVMVDARGHKASLHLAMEDRSGDSAVVEFVNGRRTVHHGRQYRVMTNDPPYGEQLALLARMDFSKPSSDTPLPGNVKATDRFQRAAYYSAMTPEPKTEREAIAGVMAIARNVSVPFGAPYKGFGIYNTEYRTAMNVTAGRYFFELTTSPNVIWADLGKFDLAPGAPVRILDPDDINLSGDVSDRFQTIAKAPF